MEPFKAQVTNVRLSAQLSSPSKIEPLPTSVETWLLVPISAPDFSLPDLSGQTRTLTALRGKPVLLNFWTNQSPGCREDWKTFNRLSRVGRAKDYKFSP